jgi:hypothetical protein
LLGVTGGIAAYKAVLVLRELMGRGHEVKVVMTEAARHFVGPITFGALLGDAPVTDLWDARYSGEIHVELADWADAMVVVPATANTMARAVHGLADDALGATWLCFDGVRILAPAMHHRMWEQAATQRNVAQLLSDGVVLAGYPGTRAATWQRSGRAGRSGAGGGAGSRDSRPARQSAAAVRVRAAFCHGSAVASTARAACSRVAAPGAGMGTAPTQPRSRTAFSTASAWPGTFTLGHTCRTTPSRSISTVVRSMPM